MALTTPEHLVDEQRALEAEIREAFKDVTREGAVSWSEAEVIDSYGSEDERAAARSLDTDKDWTELAADDQWDAGPGMGGWSFLDAVGFRYYLPAAMIRALNGGYDAFSCFAMDSILDAHPRAGNLAILDDQQRRCVAHFVRFMIARETAWDGDFEEWQRIYGKYWESVG